MKPTPNEVSQAPRGAILPVIIGLVVVVAVVSIAVWQSQKAKTNHPAASPSPTPVVRGSVTPTATPTPANEFKIPELGFKMTLPAGLMDLKYVAESNLPGDATHQPYSTSRFTTLPLERLDGSDSQCTATNNPIGTIVRYAEDPKSFTSVADSKKVGDFYLAFVTPQQPCSRSTTTNQLETSQITFFSKLLKLQLSYKTNNLRRFDPNAFLSIDDCQGILHIY